MKRVLVTGGCGFIGSNFLRIFLNSYGDAQVVNLDKLTYAGRIENTVDFQKHPRYKFVQGDICDPQVVESLMKDVDTVIHFAAESHVDRSINSPHEFVSTNVLGTQVLLNAAYRKKVARFIHFSTDEVYGSIANGSFSETDPLSPNSPYSAAKASSDLFALAYWRTYKFPIVIMRCSNNFGPYQFPEKVVPLFITNLIEGKKVPLYAQGENVRDWLFVEDCAKAVCFIYERGQIGEIYNVGGGSEVSNIQLTKSILKEFGVGEEMIQYVPDRLGHDFRYSVNTTKIEKLGFKITPNLADNLRKTIEWYKSNTSWWKPLKNDVYTIK